MRRFKRFACIDWSGAKGERLKGIAVAECGQGYAAPRLLQPAKGWSRLKIQRWLRRLAATQTDIVVGIDFSPSFPFADRGAFFPGWAQSPRSAASLWSLVDHLCRTDRDLSASSFIHHPLTGRHFRHGGDAIKAFAGTGRLRRVERCCRNLGLGAAQSCFNLVGPAQVGKSSLTGMRVLNRLKGQVPIWPFDEIPETGPLLVEIYTTIAAKQARVRRGSKLRDGAALDSALSWLGTGPHKPFLNGQYDDHSTDAILTAAWLRRAAAQRRLWQPVGLTSALARTEGWTFGVP